MSRRKNDRPTTIYWIFDIRSEALSEWPCGIPIYCGKTVKSIADRLYMHRYNARSRVKYAGRRLTEILRECGDCVRIDIVDVVSITTDWAERERYWISVIRKTNMNAVNVAEGGSGVPGLIHTAATKAKISAVHKGKKLSDTHRAAVRQANLGRQHTAEARTRMSANRKGKGGRPLSTDHHAKLLAANKGKKRPNAVRAKIAETVRTVWAQKRAEGVRMGNEKRVSL